MKKKILIFVIFIAIAVLTLVVFRINLTTDNVEEDEENITENLTPEIEEDAKENITENLTPEIEEDAEVEKESGETIIENEPIIEEGKSLKQIVYGFLGTPYKLGPLGEEEGDKIYRTDVFDCTTLVLVTASKFNSNIVSEEEIMKQANYYPASKVSYENRLHFSSYRNQVSPLFRDITEKIGKEKTKTKKVVLNKDRGVEGRIININWEKEIDLKYILKEDVPEIISFLPAEVGVAFMVDGDEKIGLDVRHEGFLFNGEKLLHASSSKGRVVEEHFLNFLEKSNYTGVIFFEIISIDN